MRVNNMIDLAALAKEERQRKGMTQSEFAARCKVSREWIVRFEKGEPRLEVALVFRALQALDLLLLVESNTNSIADADAAELLADIVNDLSGGE